MAQNKKNPSMLDDILASDDFNANYDADEIISSIFSIENNKCYFIMKYPEGEYVLVVYPYPEEGKKWNSNIVFRTNDPESMMSFLLENDY